MLNLIENVDALENNDHDDDDWDANDNCRLTSTHFSYAHYISMCMSVFLLFFRFCCCCCFSSFFFLYLELCERIYLFTSCKRWCRWRTLLCVGTYFSNRFRHCESLQFNICESYYIRTHLVLLIRITCAVDFRFVFIVLFLLVVFFYFAQ